MTDAKKLVLHSSEIRQREQSFSHPWNPKSQLIGVQLSRALGLKRTAVSIARIPPGKYGAGHGRMPAFAAFKFAPTRRRGDPPSSSRRADASDVAFRCPGRRWSGNARLAGRGSGRAALADIGSAQRDPWCDS